MFRVLLTIFLLDAYFSFVLSHFPGTDPLQRPLLFYVLAPIPGLWTALVAYLPDLIYILVVLVIARYGLKLIHFVFRAVENGIIVIRGFRTDWAETTYKIVRAAVFFLVLIAIFPHLPGTDSEFFSGVSLFVGALITLGSTGGDWKRHRGIGAHLHRSISDRRLGGDRDFNWPGDRKESLGASNPNR